MTTTVEERQELLLDLVGAAGRIAGMGFDGAARPGPELVMALDPGTRETGWAIVDTEDGEVLLSGKDPNERLRAAILDDAWSDGYDPIKIGRLLIESMNGAHAGMPFGVEKIEAVRWAGRFEETWHRWHDHDQADAGLGIVRISREEIKRVLLGSAAARNADAAIRAAIIDHYAAVAGDPLGGKAAAVGRKASPGPLYGVKADAWSAIALALAYARGALDITAERAKAAERKAAKAARKRGHA